MKVAVLDIDGVLNRSLPGCPDFEPACVERLNRLTDATGAVIVVSSTWRAMGLERVTQELRQAGVRAEVIGVTPDLSRKDGEIYLGRSRGEEIRSYLDDHPEIDRFVILDDEAGGIRSSGLLGHLVQTTAERGLSEADLHAALLILGKRE